MNSYMESFIQQYMEGIDDRAEIVPIVYPDLSKDEVEVMAPFIDQEMENDELIRETVCIVPSFEYFGRLYDVLPWMIHEASHNFRILEKPERNLFITRYFLTYVFENIVEDTMVDLSADNLYMNIGKAERCLVDSMVDVAVEEISTKEGFEKFGFRKMVREIDDYLMKLFPYCTDYEGTRHFNDSRKIYDEVFKYYLDECRKEVLLTDDNLNRLLQIKNGNAAVQRDELIEILLDKYFSYISDNVSDSSRLKVCLEDIQQERDKFEKKLLEIADAFLKEKVSEDVVREYCFKVIGLYRTEWAYMTIYNGGVCAESTIIDYLSKVYEHYQKLCMEEQRRKQRKFLADPSVMHIFRNLGLLDSEKKDKDEFVKIMLQIFLKIDYSDILPDRKFMETVYREAFADLLMVTSLGLTSFGYCRQVLQTISDARVNEKEYQYNEINNQRFQIVVAVLLEEELQGKMMINSDDDDFIELDGESIINQGIQYCEFSLKKICKKVFAMQCIEEDDERREHLRRFAGSLHSQLKIYLNSLKKDGSYKATLLYVFLHGVETADQIIKNEWTKYADIAKYCVPLKDDFWRLEYFCLGIENIMLGGYIKVPKNIFLHMKRIREMIKNENGFGCSWEKEWPCLSATKQDVGKYYNAPESIFQKESYEMLDNTIDFIQNYFYYNRFRMAGKGENYGLNGSKS